RSCWRASRVLRRSFRQDLATSLDRKSIGIKTLLVVAEMAVQRQNPVTKETSSWSAWRALGPSTDASAADWVRSASALAHRRPRFPLAGGRLRVMQAPNPHAASTDAIPRGTGQSQRSPRVFGFQLQHACASLGAGLLYSVLLHPLLVYARHLLATSFSSPLYHPSAAMSRSRGLFG
ncbi:unnamed protein product, partial [Prorocentrum cordatum]